ncbi:MAG: DUF4058 family protein [Armatimonadetes bacterium]|nr:DUF4058 family protein [Armatimonadota bacterium]
MPSPFPGMDPYLEGQVWEEFHSKLIDEAQIMLMPQIRPRYVARIEERVYLEHSREELTRAVRSDVAIVRDREAAPTPPGTGVAVLTPPAPVRVPIAMPEEVRQSYLEVRLRASGELLTVIEVLSPSNKRPGSSSRREYLRKREEVLRSPVHLVELDLLRGGERLPMMAPSPPGDYYVVLSRAEHRPLADVWPIALKQPRPVIPIPLAGTDPDVSLDLRAALNSLYDRAGYDCSIDYAHGTLPPLNKAQAARAAEVLAP